MPHRRQGEEMKSISLRRVVNNWLMYADESEWPVWLAISIKCGAGDRLRLGIHLCNGKRVMMAMKSALSARENGDGIRAAAKRHALAADQGA